MSRVLLMCAKGADDGPLKAWLQGVLMSEGAAVIEVVTTGEDFRARSTDCGSWDGWIEDCVSGFDVTGDLRFDWFVTRDWRHGRGTHKLVEAALRHGRGVHYIDDGGGFHTVQSSIPSDQAGFNRWIAGYVLTV